MNVLDILNSPWAIVPEQLNEMCSIYAAHRGVESSDLGIIKAAFGNSPSNGPKPYTVQDGIALIPIEGILAKRMGLFAQICGGMSYTSIQEDLAQALADPAVTGIILTVDSPGGAVDGCQAAGDAIFAARSQKPICAYVDGKCTSAAYWLASSASQVYIGSDSDVVGSIGIIMQHIDTSNAEHQRGVKITDMAAGRYKTVGSQHMPISAQDRNVMQDQLDHLYGNFTGVVARNRGTDPDTVHAKMADGRVFLGQQAIDAGLADGKMSLPILVQKMSKGGGSSRATSTQSNSRYGSTPRRSNADGVSAAPASTAALNEPSTPAASAPVAATPTPVPATKAEQQVAQLRVLFAEEASVSRLLKDAEASKKTAQSALSQAARTYRNAADLLPYTTALERSENTVREMRARLKSNTLNQTAVLHGESLELNQVSSDDESPSAEVQRVGIDPEAIAAQARRLMATAKADGKILSVSAAVLQVMESADSTRGVTGSFDTKAVAAKASALVTKARASGSTLSYAAAVARVISGETK